ncbi:hypothetical protein P8452_29200 [Trifolium repens]|nr:hypothetical protein P8452_29200 [Trifolium repens]
MFGRRQQCYVSLRIARVIFQHVHLPLLQKRCIFIFLDLSSSKDKIEEHQQHQNFPDESTIESTSNLEIGKNLIVEDDLKSPSVVGLISMFINL